MNRNRLILIGFAAVMAAGAISILVYRILNAAVASAYSPNAVAVVAAFDLPVGSVVTERDVKVVRYSGDIPDGAFRQTKDVVGRGVITSVARNEMLLPSKLAAENAGGGLPAMIPQGKRAVTVKVNEVIGVAGFALPGTRVDVVVIGNVERDNSAGNVTAITVLQNVQVLAAGQKLQTSNEGKAETVQVITLLVTPEEAQKLALASQEGRIQLTLRNPLDVDATPVHAVKNSSIYGVGGPAPVRHVASKQVVAAAPKPVIYTVETIKGNKRDVTSFPEGSSGDEK
jgi:pilus assembly protein CpaB